MKIAFKKLLLFIMSDSSQVMHAKPDFKIEESADYTLHVEVHGSTGRLSILKEQHTAFLMHWSENNASGDQVRSILERTFQKKQLSFLPEAFTLIPDILYDERLAYRDVLGIAENFGDSYREKIPGLNLFLVAVQANSSTREWIGSYGFDEVRCANGQLLNALSTQKAIELLVSVHFFNSERIAITAIQKGKLVFHNLFELVEAEDLVFYLVQLREHWPAAGTKNIFLSGNYEEEDEYLELLERRGYSVESLTLVY